MVATPICRMLEVPTPSLLLGHGQCRQQHACQNSDDGDPPPVQSVKPLCLERNVFMSLWV